MRPYDCDLGIAVDELPGSDPGLEEEGIGRSIVESYSLCLGGGEIARP